MDKRSDAAFPSGFRSSPGVWNPQSTDRNFKQENLMFATPRDLHAIHEAAGEVCDYAAMKAAVLTDLAPSGLFS